MKECNILDGSNHIVTPATYFQGVRTPQPPWPVMDIGMTKSWHT